MLQDERAEHTSLKTSDFDYALPQDLIAQTPIEPRDHSRLLVLSRKDGSIQHRRFFQIVDYLRPGDVMVFNDSRVIPARLFGHRAETGGKVEFLLLRPLGDGQWEALAKPGRRLHTGARVLLDGGEESAWAEITGQREDGVKLVRLSSEEAVERVGHVPLPPYIHEPLKDAERYQTVYARVKGSAAAPTAGLHFTQELLGRLQEKGVEFGFVTLHVGLDTFRPVDEEDPRAHRLHSEYAILPEETARAVNLARVEGRRIVCVGTTTARVLESAGRRAGEGEAVGAFSGWTGLLILPGYRFRAIDVLVTNFHLPRSSLLMLVSAFAGRETVLRAYAAAVAERYRFYSFGDAMVIE